MVSDHTLVLFSLKVKKSTTSRPTQWVTSRAWRRLSDEDFASDLADSQLCCNLSEHADATVDDLIDLYRRVMTELLNKHCPVVKVRRRVKPSTPWFDANCRAAHRSARAAERRFRWTYSASHRSSWTTKLKTMRLVYEKKSDEFWRNEIAANSGNTKSLWRTMQGLLGETSATETGVHTADDFATFFKNKVDAVRASTAATPLHEVSYRTTASTLDDCSAVTDDEVEKLIASALNKTCQLDPAPTWLVKEMWVLLAPFIALLFNRSLAVGYFPTEIKQAVVRPLLKKSGLDAVDLKNYRSVSNLSFLSKLLEKVVQVRLQAFLDGNDLMPCAQSAYRKYHSTETAVANDLLGLLTADQGQVSALCLLDLTAVFDTIDHELLLLWNVTSDYVWDGVTLQSLGSYLSGRSFQVLCGGSMSSSVVRPILCSVPQGSVLGPRLFIMVALCHRADHYIFALWLLSIYISIFFPRLISAAGDWMSTILPHMVWP